MKRTAAIADVVGSPRVGPRRLAARLCVLAMFLAGSARGASPVTAMPLRAVETGVLVSRPNGQRLEEIVTFTSTISAALLQVPIDGRVRIADWPIAPGVRRAVTLGRHDVYAPDARIVKITPEGDVEVPRSRWLFFWGSDDEGASNVVVSLDPDRATFQAMSTSDDGVNELTPQEEGSRRHRLGAPLAETLGAQPPSWTCAAETLPPTPPAGPGASTTLAIRPESIESFTMSAVVAIDTDNEYMLNRFNNDTTAAANYIASLFASMDVVYERDVSLHLLQGYTILRVSTVADPYTVNDGGNADGNELSEFSTYWSNHYGDVKRTTTAMLSGKQPGSGSASGIAWISGLCSSFSGYSFDQLFQNNYLFGDTLILAHEIGHNFGSPHTHCYSPPADECYNQEHSLPSCYTGATISCPAPQTINGVTGVTGTLMGYCQLIGCEQVLAFHPRTLSEYFNSHIAAASACIFPAVGSTLPPDPTVSSISPNSGLIGGGTPVTIFGSNFSANPTVAFVDLTGSVSLTVGTATATSITATTPAHAAGPVDVVVMNSDNQTGTLGGGFLYSTVVPAPTISAVSPTFGPTTGATRLTITGVRFQSGTGVTVGGGAATGITFVNSTTMTATTPAHVSGAVDVVVTNPDTQTGTLPGGFTYNSGISFYTVTPCRVLDTRNTAGPYGGPALPAGGTRSFTIGGQCGIPANAKAVAVNIAVTQSTTGPAFVTMYPGGNGRPQAAMINYNAGQTRANNAILPLGAAGDVAAYCGQGSGTVQLIVDVNGFFR